MEDKKDKREQFLSDKPTKKINLSLAELLFIDDNSTMAINGAEFEGMIPVRVPQATPCTIVTIDFIDKMVKGNENRGFCCTCIRRRFIFVARDGNI